MRTHVFDMDGTLIASNAAKSRAFWVVASQWGADIADDVVAYHQQAGSISRRERWEHIFAEIVQITPTREQFDRALTLCSHYVATFCDAVAPIRGAHDYVRNCEGRKVVVSGVRQPELDDMLRRHGYHNLFDSVHGGDKQQLLTDLIAGGTIELPAVYYGDTRDDWQTATAAGLEFVLVTADAEWRWQAEYNGPRIVDFTEAA